MRFCRNIVLGVKAMQYRKLLQNLLFELGSKARRDRNDLWIPFRHRGTKKKPVLPLLEHRIANIDSQLKQHVVAANAHHLFRPMMIGDKEMR